MNHSNSLSGQTFPDNALDPPPPIYGHSSSLPPPAAGGPSPAAAAPDIIYVQRFFSPGGNKPTHETSWSTSMCGCCSDMNTCLVTAACPCITAGRIAEIVDEGKTSCQEGVILYTLLSLVCMHGVYSSHTRSKMRKQHMLRGNPCIDCLAHTYCSPCALCQEYRELNRLGLDPGIGWHENVEREKHAVAVFKITPPSMEGGMMR